jgi:hypothetical protein
MDKGILAIFLLARFCLSWYLFSKLFNHWIFVSGASHTPHSYSELIQAALCPEQSAGWATAFDYLASFNAYLIAFQDDLLFGLALACASGTAPLLTWLFFGIDFILLKILIILNKNLF